MNVLRPSTPKSKRHRRIANHQRAMVSNPKLSKALIGYMHELIEGLTEELQLTYVLLRQSGRE